MVTGLQGKLHINSCNGVRMRVYSSLVFLYFSYGRKSYASVFPHSLPQCC